jgi:hypothetical protein
VIARVKQHDIARNQFNRWHPLFAPIAAHCRFSNNHSAQSLDGIFSLGFLNVAGKCEDENDTKDYRAIDKLAQRKHEAAGDKQNIKERLMELQKKSFPRRRAAFFRQFIGTVLL